MKLFRITQQRSRAAAFDGVGSSLYPGRWNERTKRVVYVTSRIPLGILEIMVQSSGTPLAGYVAFPLEVPDELLDTLDRAALSRSWRTADPGRAECRRHGERWRAGDASAGIIVPSAVLPEAYDFGDVNVVLNPLHPAFSGVTIDEPVPLDVDTRLQALISLSPPQRPLPKRRRKS